MYYKIKNNFYYKITRVRFAKDEPYIYHQSYIRVRYIQQPDAPLEHFQSIYQRFKLDFNIHMSEEPFIETNEICFPTPEAIADQLQLTEPQPTVFQVKTTSKNGTEEVLEYTETYKHWKYYKFEIAANKH